MAIFGSGRSRLLRICMGLLAVVSVEAQRRAAPGVESTSTAQGSEQRRTAPPENIGCSRDRLTSYEGRVLSYQRRQGRTTIRIRTDWDTTEQVTVRHPGTDNPSKWFLLRREPFRHRDWKFIEVSRNRLRPRMRANIWVCEDGSSNPVVDWQPPQN